MVPLLFHSKKCQYNVKLMMKFSDSFQSNRKERHKTQMKRNIVLSILAILVLFSAQICFAQTAVEIDGMKKDINALKEGQQAIQKELAEIKSILRQKPAPAEFKETVINVGNDPSKGDKKAKLALIEFSDYQ